MPGPRLLDELLPVYDVSDGVAVVVAADVATAWTRLLDTDLIALGKRHPAIGVLGVLRALPELLGHLLRGERPAKPPARMTLRDLPALPRDQGGWVRLDERPGAELDLGLVGKFWKPVIPYAEITTREDFLAFSTPGYAKTVYALCADELPDGCTLLTAVMRTSTTDERARRWFRRYWTLGVGPGAHVLARGLLVEARDAAERTRH